MTKENLNSPKARILATGMYVPERILSNKDLEKMVDTSDEWIVTRTGMKERRIAHAEEFASDMGFKAAEDALKKSGISAEQIDLILVATSTPDYVFPSTACLLQNRLGAKSAGALDIQAACTGYLYGLSIAKAYIESGIYKTILLVAAEKLSSVTNYQDRTTCVLFGDGAAASVISDQGPGLLIRDICLGADGEKADLLKLQAGGCRYPASQETVTQGMHYIQMDGQEVFKHAVRRMENAIKQCLTDCDLKEEDISWLIPHQANERIIDAIGKRFNVPAERVFKTVHKYGNTSASTIPIAVHDLSLQHQIKPSENLVLVAFGAGLTWGAAILTQI